MSFYFFSQGILREFRKNIKKNRGNPRKLSSDPERESFVASLGYVRFVPCVQVVSIDF